jgi:signal transduction histidine kinase
MNALQAMDGLPNTRLELRTRQDDGMAHVSVRDSGPGIADADGARLFEPFFSTKADGMGLGLPICRSIISRHGGRIAARSTPPGATFGFELPIHEKAPVHEQQSDALP